MFAFSEVEPNRTFELTRFNVSTLDWLSTRYREGVDYQAGKAISRFTEDMIAEGPEISAELANKQWGIPGHLEFSGPIKVQEAALRNERKKRELELQGRLNAAEHSWASWKAVAGFGASMVGNMSHPLDFGLMFLPVTGSVARAKAAAQAGRGIVRQQIARGIITEESLAMMTRFPKFGATVIDGTIGNAIAEIPVFVQKVRDQADYGLADAATNIAAGGIFAGGLHIGFRGIQKVFDRLSPEIKEKMVQHEVDALLRDETPEHHKIAQVDENAIAAKVEEDLRAEAEVSIGVRPQEQRVEGVLTSSAQVDREIHLQFDLDGKVPTPEELTAKFKERGHNVEFVQSGKTEIQKGGKTTGTVSFRGVAADEAQAKGAMDDVMGASASKAEFETRAADERERRIREYIESRKPERIAAAKAAELQARVAQGKILTEEQIKESTVASDEGAAAKLDEDIKALEADLQAQVDAKLKDEALTPEQKQALQDELDELLEQADEGIVDESKAIEQAKNCLLQNG